MFKFLNCLKQLFKRQSDRAVLYICDMGQCDDCHHCCCEHTQNIEHAKNFRVEVK